MPKPLIVDSDIHAFDLAGEGQLYDADLLTVLKRFETRVGLSEIGLVSKQIFWQQNPNIRSRAALFDGDSILFSQWALAYLAAALIRSGGNDYRKRTFAVPGRPLNNLIALNGVRHDHLALPELLPGYGPMTRENLDSTTLRMAFEQFPYQTDALSDMARSIYLFNELSEKVQTDDIKDLKALFLEITGLTMAVYFDISFAIACLTQERSVVSLKTISETEVATMKGVLSIDNLQKYVKFMGADYSSFRKMDEEMNRTLPPEYTRYRFNPLCRTPIVISQRDNLHIIPSTSLFVRAAFPGLFWLFDSYFFERKEIEKFRDYFGKLYELYVGDVLKDIYGPEQVKHGGYLQKSYEFFDWYVEYKDVIYLFEAKAYQYPLKIQTVATLQDIDSVSEQKIGYIVDQVGRKMRDVKIEGFLAEFRGKRLCPVVVIWDMPLISSKQFAEKISRLIVETKKKYGLDELALHFMEIHELELLVSLGKPTPLSDVFEEVDREFHENAGSVIRRRYMPSQNPMLKRIFSEFTDRISPAIADRTLRNKATNETPL